MTQDMGSRMIIEDSVFPRWALGFDEITARALRAVTSLATRLRLVVTLLLMMVLGVNVAWGQTDYSGTYYIASGGKGEKNGGNGGTTYIYNSSSPSDNFYLCPTEGWCYYKPTDDFSSDGTTYPNPFLTTFKCRSNDYHNGDASDAVWIIKKAPNSDYYYIIQKSTGRYLVSNGQIRTTDNPDRIRVHLESITDPTTQGDKVLFNIVISTLSSTYIEISPRGITDGTHSAHNDHDKHRWLTVNYGNYNYLVGKDGKGNGPTGYTKTSGIVCIYSAHDANAPFCLETPTPTFNLNIENKVELSGLDLEHSDIYYTTDGSDPVVPEVGQDLTSPTLKYTTAIPLVNNQIMIKAIATNKGHFVNSPIITYVYTQDITWTETSFEYNGTAQVPTVTSVKIGEDVVSAAEYDISCTDNTDAGTATLTLTDKVAGNNYIVSGSKTFEIAPRVASLTWSSTELQYSGSAQQPTATVSNLVEGDECTVTVSVPDGDGITIGSYTATATALSNTNYALPAEVTQTFSITKKDVTFSGITAAGKVYDKTTTATLDYSSVTFGGLIAGDVLTISATGAFVDANAGENKTVNITDPVLGGGSVANYQLATEGQQTTTTATISKKPVTVSGGVTVQNKVYDGTTTATFDCSSATIDGKIAGDDLTVSATGTFANPNVGEGITVTFTSFVLGGESADNYVLESSGQQASTTANITPATLTVTADAKTKVFGETDPALTYTPTGLAEGDNLATILNNGALARAAGENVGSYAIGQGTLDLVSNSGNYTLSYVGANLTITEKNLNEGTELAEGITIEITKSGDAYVPVVKHNGTTITEGTGGPSYDYSLSTDGSPSSKYYEVSITGANNYSGSVTVKYANYKSGKKDTTDEEENWSGTFVSNSGDGDIAIPSGMAAYIVTGVSGNVVEVEELDFIPEGVPVLLLSDDFAYCFVVKAKEDEGTTDTSDNLLEKATGTSEQRTMAVGTVYIVYNGEFVLNMPGELDEGTVYLPKSAIDGSNSPAPARLTFKWRENTGIENVQISPPGPQPSGPWYTLDGRRLTNKPVKKGLYLRNREKIVIR